MLLHYLGTDQLFKDGDGTKPAEHEETAWSRAGVLDHGTERRFVLKVTVKLLCPLLSQQSLLLLQNGETNLPQSRDDLKKIRHGVRLDEKKSALKLERT